MLNLLPLSEQNRCRDSIAANENGLSLEFSPFAKRSSGIVGWCSAFRVEDFRYTEKTPLMENSPDEVCRARASEEERCLVTSKQGVRRHPKLRGPRGFPCMPTDSPGAILVHHMVDLLKPTVDVHSFAGRTRGRPESPSAGDFGRRMLAVRYYNLGKQVRSGDPVVLGK